jgi:hypothetical protein
VVVGPPLRAVECRGLVMVGGGWTADDAAVIAVAIETCRGVLRPVWAESG